MIVYIFENIEAKRVKVGMSINSGEDRLKTINDMWSERLVTCQICAGRRLNAGGIIPQHENSGGFLPRNRHRKCSGGNELPLEKDISIAEYLLNALKSKQKEHSASEKNSLTRMVNNLEKRIGKYRCYKTPVGNWKCGVIYHTKYSEEVEKKHTHYFQKN